jgi:hypothetical protein
MHVCSERKTIKNKTFSSRLSSCSIRVQVFHMLLAHAKSHVHTIDTPAPSTRRRVKEWFACFSDDRALWYTTHSNIEGNATKQQSLKELHDFTAAMRQCQKLIPAIKSSRAKIIHSNQIKSNSPHTQPLNSHKGRGMFSLYS